jgi:hypothetical protein
MPAVVVAGHILGLLQVLEGQEVAVPGGLVVVVEHLLLLLLVLQTLAVEEGVALMVTEGLRTELGDLVGLAW